MAAGTASIDKNVEITSLSTYLLAQTGLQTSIQAGGPQPPEFELAQIKLPPLFVL